MDDEEDQQPERPEDREARLARNHVMSIQESVTPMEVFRPAQQYCWDHKCPPADAGELSDIVRAFADDRALRSWIQEQATPVQVYTLWESIAALARRFFLLEDDEKPDPDIVAEVRQHPSAKAVFLLAIKLKSLEDEGCR